MGPRWIALGFGVGALAACAPAPAPRESSPGAIAYERARVCEARAYAAKRPPSCSKGAPVERLGARPPRRVFDHERLAPTQRVARDTDVRSELRARLGGLAHDVALDDDGFASVVTVTDPCVGPRGGGPPARVNDDDVALAVEIISRAPDLFGVAASASLELVCNMGSGADLREGARWPGRFDGDHPPMTACVVVAPRSPLGGRIVVSRTANVEAHCAPGLVISGHLWPAVDEPPPIATDLGAWRAAHVGATVTRPGTPGGRFCMPVLPRGGEPPPGEHCQNVAPLTPQSSRVQRARVAELRALSWDKASARFVMARRLTLSDEESGATLDQRWDPAPPGAVVVESQPIAVEDASSRR